MAISDISNTAIGIGEMRSSVTFEQNNPVDDASGGQVDHFTVLLETRGRLRKLRGNKNLEQGDVVFDAGFELICRWRSDLVINRDTRVTISGDHYRINDYSLQDEIKHWYRFTISKNNG
jgi:SPP1 family predicted phage head-tail adaptor